MIEKPKAHHLFLLLTSAFVVNPGILLPVHGQTCTPEEFACINCTTVQMCTDGIPSGPVLTCPGDTICSESAQFECSLGVCFSCPSAGRFPDPNDPGRYFLCLPNAAGGFDKIEMTCPPGTLLDSKSRCAFPVTTTTTMETTTTTTAMTTPTSTTTTTRTTPTTTSTTTTTPIPTTTIYPCLQEGRFPDVTNCSNYFLCASDTMGGFNVYKYTCPRTTEFSPTVRKCVLASGSGCTPISG